MDSLVENEASEASAASAAPEPMRPVVTPALCTDSHQPICPRCGVIVSSDLRTADGVVTSGTFRTIRTCVSCHALYSVSTTVKVTSTTSLLV
jgi:hypothetical protein